MAYDLSQLNEAQLNAVRDTEGPVLVLAGAGSGKTRVLTHRICYIVEKGLAPSWNILAITFSNKATNEMKERLGEMLGEDHGVWVSTFHSFCARVLRKFGSLIGYGQNFSIYNDADRDRVIRKALRELHLDGDKIKDCIADIISTAKNDGLDPEQLFARIRTADNAEDAVRVYRRYEELLKENNACDFDDLLLKTRVLFEENEEALSYYQNRFRYIHVDEFQDTNAVQLDIVKLLAAKHGNLFVVGDDDQSIYGWRGADIQNILEFDKNFNAHVYKLEQNYRSTGAILTAANNVICHNSARHEKKLFTENGKGVKVEFYEAYNDRQEVDWVVNAIYSLKSWSGYKNKDIAILVRANSLTRVFEQRLNSERLGYKIYGGFKFFDRKEVQDVLAYMRVVANPKDGAAIERIINFPRRGIGDTTVQKLSEYASENNEDLFDVIAHIEQLKIVNAGTAKKISEFYALLSELHSYSGESLLRFTDRMIRAVGFESELCVSGKEEDYNRWLNIQEFSGYVGEYSKQHPNASLQEFLETCTLENAPKDDEDDNDKLVISTMHMVKGLEFPVVFIVGCEENIFPSGMSLKEGEKGLEEERRIMYVAVTRAKERLYISCSKQRFMYNSVRTSIPSRFIREAKGIAEPDPFEQSERFGMRSSGDGYSNSGYPNVDYPSTPKRVQTKKFNPLDTIQGAAKTETKRDASKFYSGQKVVHTKYGEGTILVVTGSGDNTVGTIAFPSLGLKKFNLNTAPLTVAEKKD